MMNNKKRVQKQMFVLKAVIANVQNIYNLIGRGENNIGGFVLLVSIL